jgi:hypothetical protein
MAESRRTSIGMPPERIRSYEANLLHLTVEGPPSIR